jgi:hypothetical protein
MSFTGTEVVQIAQRLLVDIDDEAYSDDLLDYLNEASRRLAAETHCCQAVEELAVAAHYVDYADIAELSNDAGEVLFVPNIMNLTNDNPYFLDKASLYSRKSLPDQSVTVPTRFWCFGKKIWFDLNPSATISFTANIYFSYIPTALSSLGENVKIPDAWIMALVNYVAYCCHLADRSAGLANGFFDQYEKIKAQAAAIYAAEAK